MNHPALLVAFLLSFTTALSATVHPATGVDRDALQASLRSAIVRAAYVEYVADVIASIETQADAFRAAPKEVGMLPPEVLRAQLATIDTLVLSRERIGQSRRALLACTLLTREEAELLLGQLQILDTRSGQLVREETAPRKVVLLAALEAALAVPEARPALPPEFTPAQVLEEAKLRLRPSGIVLIDSQYELLLDGRRAKAGSTFTVRLDRDYTVTIASVRKSSYTLALGEATLLVSMN